MKLTHHSETRSWDVRTKRVTYDIVPTIDGVIGLANYGPTATLFTLGRNHTVQQYDISPMAVPLQVQSVQHAPANTPPTPPTSLEEQNNPYAGSHLPGSSKGAVLARHSDAESSTDESTGMSPLDKIAREMDSLDQLERSGIRLRRSVPPPAELHRPARSLPTAETNRGNIYTIGHLHPESRTPLATTVRSSLSAAEIPTRSAIACRSALVLHERHMHASGHQACVERFSGAPKNLLHTMQ
jgi:hypothetical protein